MATWVYMGCAFGAHEGSWRGFASWLPGLLRYQLISVADFDRMLAKWVETRAPRGKIASVIFCYFPIRVD